MTPKKKLFYATFYTIPIALAIGLIMGPMLRHGMFLDGLVYTNIARMLASDIGGIWQPLVYPNGHLFYEHPVLLPWIESLFFHVFGDSLHTEDLYNFSVFALTILGMYLIWKQLVQAEHRGLFFFPLLLWLLSQEVQLRYPNTMLECGTTLILLFSTCSYLKIQQKHPVLSYLVVGIGVFLAVLSKGPFGLFLLALPFLHQYLIANRYSILSLVVPLISTSLCLCFLFSLQPVALTFFLQYIDQQVLASIAGERIENIADSRFDFIYWLFILNLPAIIIGTATALVKSDLPLTTKKEGKLFLLLGFVAIVPLAVSIKQAAYYQLISLPFFFLGMGLLLVPKINLIVAFVSGSRRYHTILFSLGVISVIGSSVHAYSMIGTTDRRNRETIEMAANISIALKEQSKNDYNLLLLGNKSSAASRGYYLTAYLARNHSIHLNETEKAASILVINHGNDPLPNGSKSFFKKDDIHLLKQIE